MPSVTEEPVSLPFLSGFVWCHTRPHLLPSCITGAVSFGPFSPGDVAVQVPSHSAVFINEPRLSEFKQLVVSKGIQAEMSGGVLICNNVVAVRRVRGCATLNTLHYAVFTVATIHAVVQWVEL